MQPFIPTVDARIHFDFPDSLAAKTREYQQTVAQDIAAGGGLQRRNSLDLSFGPNMDASVDKENPNPNPMMGGGYNSPVRAAAGARRGARGAGAPPFTPARLRLAPRRRALRRRARPRAD